MHGSSRQNTSVHLKLLTPCSGGSASLCPFFCLCKHFHLLSISCQKPSPIWCSPAKKDIRECLCCREKREYDPVHHPFDLVNKNSSRVILPQGPWTISCRNKCTESLSQIKKKKGYFFPCCILHNYYRLEDARAPPTSAHNTSDFHRGPWEGRLWPLRMVSGKEEQPDSVPTKEAPVARKGPLPYHRALKNLTCLLLIAKVNIWVLATLQLRQNAIITLT